MTGPLYLEPPLRTLTIDGRQRSWREWGEGGGLPLVLLHGIGSNSRAWAAQFAHFAKARRVIAWNAPGYPGSDRLDDAAPSPADYAGELAALLDALGVARCILIGQSLGAIMATAFTAASPQRVAALALASPAGGYAIPAGGDLPANVRERVDAARLHGAQGLSERRAHRLLTRRAAPIARDIVRSAMAEIDPDGYAQASMMLAHADLRDMVTHLAVPTLTLWGEEDIVTIPEKCAALGAAVPGGACRTIAQGGHAFATECPAQFNAAITEWLEGLGSLAAAAPEETQG